MILSYLEHRPVPVLNPAMANNGELITCEFDSPKIMKPGFYTGRVTLQNRNSVKFGLYSASGELLNECHKWIDQ